MHLTISIDLSAPGFRHGPAEEVARILHHAAEQLVTMHHRYGSLSHEKPAQLHLNDNTGAYVGYVSTVQIDDISPDVQDRICSSVVERSTHLPCSSRR
jgi:hypothetical protein